MDAQRRCRFDWFSTYFPDVHLGPGPNVPTRNFTIPAYEWYNWKDISPRGGAVYDLRGNGKTALKFGYNKFMAAATTTLDELYDPGSATTITASLPWTDKNGNFKPTAIC
jgi:hypothetical protein